jgi:hypothetical protein
MTAAERIRREGEEKAGREYLIAMLQARFAALPADILAAIDAAEKPTLDLWFIQGMIARDLDDVFDDDT